MSVRARSWILALTCLVGCQIIDRRLVLEPGRDQVLHVMSGDRLYFDLEEDPTTGLRWSAVCDDDDVEVSLERESVTRESPPAKRNVCVRLRVHRGYDGPSLIHFTERGRNQTKSARAFTIMLFKKNGDSAAWK